jgi:hypothetical protein
MTPPSSSPSTLEKPRVRLGLWVVASVSAVALVIGMIVGVLAIYELTEATRATQLSNAQRSQDTKAAAEQAARSADRIEDCTTPGRECFEESQQRLGRTVGSLNDYALAAAYCADQVGAQTIVQLEDCIRGEVARDRASRRTR